MYCVKCGKELPSGSIFCPSCGHKIKTDSEANDPNASNDSVNPKVEMQLATGNSIASNRDGVNKRNNIGKILAFILILVIVITVSLVFILNQDTGKNKSFTAEDIMGKYILFGNGAWPYNYYNRDEYTQNRLGSWQKTREADDIYNTFYPLEEENAHIFISEWHFVEEESGYKINLGGNNDVVVALDDDNDIVWTDKFIPIEEADNGSYTWRDFFCRPQFKTDENVINDNSSTEEVDRYFSDRYKFPLNIYNEDEFAMEGLEILNGKWVDKNNRKNTIEFDINSIDNQYSINCKLPEANIEASFNNEDSVNGCKIILDYRETGCFSIGPDDCYTAIDKTETVIRDGVPMYVTKYGDTYYSKQNKRVVSWVPISENELAVYYSSYYNENGEFVFGHTTIYKKK